MMLTSQQCKHMDIEAVNDILSPIEFITTPMEHQARSLVWSIDRNRLAYWLDVGTGKTLLALYTLKLWGCRRTLIICPNSVTQTWADEIDKHLGWDYVILKGTAGERKAKLAEDHQLYIINYEGLRVLWARKVGNKYKPNVVAMNDFGFDSLVCDESHRLKQNRTLVYRITYELSKRVNNCITMTGTPLTKDEKDLWAEMSVMDLGASLGHNYYSFLRKNFKPGFFDWKIKDGALEEIMEKVAPNTIRYEREECFDLPDAVYEQRSIPMSVEQEKLVHDVLHNIPSEWTQTDALHCGNKLAQISGGFMYGEETLYLLSNPKLQELLRLVDEISGKFIVFHHFSEEGRLIAEALRKHGIDVKELRGETKDKEVQIDQFKSDPAVQCLVAHPACGGEGLNLQVASTMIFFSNGFSFAHRIQAEGRIHRLGQTNKCLYIDLLMTAWLGEQTIDHHILDCLNKKGDMAKAVLDYIRGEKG